LLFAAHLVGHCRKVAGTTAFRTLLSPSAPGGCSAGQASSAQSRRRGRGPAHPQLERLRGRGEALRGGWQLSVAQGVQWDRPHRRL